MNQILFRTVEPGGLARVALVLVLSAAQAACLECTWESRTAGGEGFVRNEVGKPLHSTPITLFYQEDTFDGWSGTISLDVGQVPGVADFAVAHIHDLRDDRLILAMEPTGDGCTTDYCFFLQEFVSERQARDFRDRLAGNHLYADFHVPGDTAAVSDAKIRATYVDDWSDVCVVPGF